MPLLKIIGSLLSLYVWIDSSPDSSPDSLSESPGNASLAHLDSLQALGYYFLSSWIDLFPPLLKMALPPTTIVPRTGSDADQLLKADSYLGELEAAELADAISSAEKPREWWFSATGVVLVKKGPTASKWFDVLTNQDWKDAALDYVLSSNEAAKGWNISQYHGRMQHRFKEVGLRDRSRNRPSTND